VYFLAGEILQSVSPYIKHIKKGEHGIKRHRDLQKEKQEI
jgi:hypothetical protein